MRQLEYVGIVLDHLLDEFNLFQCLEQRGALTSGTGWDIDRPELGTDIAGFQAWNIGMQSRLRLRDVHFGERTIAFGAHCPGEVVVAVKDESVPVYAERVFGDLNGWSRAGAAPLSRTVYDAAGSVSCQVAVVQHKLAIDQHITYTGCELVGFRIGGVILN